MSHSTTLAALDFDLTIMKNLRNFPLIVFGFLALCAIYLVSATSVHSNPSAAQNGDSYGYCSVTIGRSGQTKYVVSSVYRLQAGTYSVGVQNSFRDYVDGNFEERASSTPTCYTTIDTYQEAADSRNDWIGRLRQNKWTVYTVNWSYRGD